MNGITIDWAVHRQPDVEIAQRCMAALNAGLDTEELGMVMYELSLDHIDQYEYKEIPARPNVLSQFKADQQSYDWNKKTMAEREASTKRVNGRSEVKDYLERAYKRTARNLSNVLRLEQMISSFLEWDESDKAKACWNVHQRYPETLVFGESRLWQKKRKW